MIALAISNKIQITEDCNTLFLKYKNNRNAFDFNYESDEDFYQQVRIGGHLRSDKTPKKEKIYRDSAGVFRRGNTYVDKTVQIVTDLVDEPFRDAFAVAMAHTDVIINDVEYSCQGDIDVGDNDFNNLANLTATLYVQGFNQTNYQC